METLPKPYTECYVFDDPRNVYDLTGWNPTEKLYRLENDHGRKRYLRYFEFCPIAAAHDELLEAGDDGKIYTVQQLVDAKGHLAWKRPTWAEEGSEGPAVRVSMAERPEVAATPRKPKESQAKGHDEASDAKGQVRELLAGLTDRLELAKAASEILGEDPETLMAKYQHLDNGRYRMTLGNRMVGVLNKCK